MDIGRTMIPNHLPRKRYVVKAFPLATVFFFSANLCFATLRCKKTNIQKVGLLEFAYCKWNNKGFSEMMSILQTLSMPPKPSMRITKIYQVIIGPCVLFI